MGSSGLIPLEFRFNYRPGLAADCCAILSRKLSPGTPKLSYAFDMRSALFVGEGLGHCEEPLTEKQDSAPGSTSCVG